MDWVFDHGFLPEGPIEAVDSVIAATGAILTGTGKLRRRRRGPTPRDGVSVRLPAVRPQFVLTHRPPRDLPADVDLLPGDIGEVVRPALAAARGKNLLVLGANAV